MRRQLSQDLQHRPKAQATRCSSVFLLSVHHLSLNGLLLLLFRLIDTIRHLRDGHLNDNRSDPPWGRGRFDPTSIYVRTCHKNCLITGYCDGVIDRQVLLIRSTASLNEVRKLLQLLGKRAAPITGPQFVDIVQLNIASQLVLSDANGTSQSCCPSATPWRSLRGAALSPALDHSAGRRSPAAAIAVSDHGLDPNLLPLDHLLQLEVEAFSAIGRKDRLHHQQIGQRTPVPASGRALPACGHALFILRHRSDTAFAQPILAASSSEN